MSSKNNFFGQTILAVDDVPNNLDLLTKMLGERGYLIRTAISGKVALMTAMTEPPDLVLLDIDMPEMDGYEVCRQFKQEESLRNIPIIFLTFMSETDAKIRAFEEGGVDYITKPFEPREVESRIKTHLLIREQRRQLIESAKVKYFSIFNNAVEGIFQASADGKIITANPAFLSMVGYRDANKINLNKNYFVHRKSFQTLKSILRDKETVERFESEVYHKNGDTLWVSINVRSAIKDDDQSIFYEGLVENVTDLKKAEHDLKMKSVKLEKTNIALNVLLEKIKESNKKENDLIFSNIRNSILPYIDALNQTKISEKQKEYLGLIENNLLQIASPFIHSLRQFNLTPSEIEIANLIKEGRTSKDIARLLSKSKATVDFQRYKLRKKLKINNKKSNLESYLASLDEQIQ